MFSNACSYSITGNAARRFFLLGASILVWCILVLGVSAAEGQKVHSTDAGYLWPTNASHSLSSTFAETRDGHYHFGLDIRTNHSEGYPCYAIEDGDVVRLRVSPYGYGKALYLQLKDGRMAVYAHLQRFAPRLEEIVKAKQYRTRSYRCQMTFEPGELSFQRGDIIAYSGSTGIGVPHLHFEIRESDGYRNALLYGYHIADSTPPVPTKLALVPLAFNAEINGGFFATTFPLRSAPKRKTTDYFLQKSPEIFGVIGLAVSCFDRLDGANNRVGIYGLDFYLDDSLCYSVRYDAIRYDEVKQIELERDFRLQRQGKGIFHHLWKDSLSTLPIYKAGKGVVDTRDYPPGEHYFEIVLSDFAGNCSRVSGSLYFADASRYPPLTVFSPDGSFFNTGAALPHSESSAKRKPLSLRTDFLDDRVIFSLPADPRYQEVEFFIIQPFAFRIPAVKTGKTWLGKAPLLPSPVGTEDWIAEVRAEDTTGVLLTATVSRDIQPIPTSGGTAVSDDGEFRAHFHPNTVYRTVYARVIEEPAPAEEIFKSRIYRLEPRDVPIRGDVEVAISIPSDAPQPDKLGIYYFTSKGKWSFVDNDLRTVPGAVTGASPRLESFVLIEDTAPPVLRWLAPNLTSTDRRPFISLFAEDTLSGVDDRTVSVEIDGSWLLMVYDYEEHRLTGQPEAALAWGEHHIEVQVRDFNGNKAVLSRRLTIVNP